ncbi:hypothetical protein GCM10027093_65080 [Paraburkholderia jirisanensis]
MSYLQFPRLAFTGKFQADVSTVNNDPRHFDSKTFEPEFQQFSTSSALNGWWNPTGTAILRFDSCTVKSLRDRAGRLLTDLSADPLLGCNVGNSLDRPSGKMVDLDTDWQLASNIYGLSVSLVGRDGKPIMTARYESNPFRDLWFARASGGGDMGASAMFQSILTDVIWHRDDLHSPFLDQLRDASERDALSVRLTTYGYKQKVKNDAGELVPDFGYGTLIGNIGPAIASQPRSFILGRRFMPTTQNAAGDMASTTGIGCFSSFIDTATNTLQVDLSNALPINAKNQIAQTGGLQFAVLRDESITQQTELGQHDYVVLGNVDQSQDLQMIEGGIQSLPLSNDMLLALRGKPLAIVQTVETPTGPVVQVNVREAPYGLEVRPETFTFKLDPNDSRANRAESVLYAAQYGEPCVNRALNFWIGSPAPDFSNTPASQAPGATPKALLPVNNIPGDGLHITPADVRTDARGQVRITVAGPETMGNPRGYIDGQLYVVSYNFAGDDTAIQQPFDKIAAVVYSTFPAQGQTIDLNHPSWEDVQPILQQYANLYPVMSKGLFDFSKKEVADSAAFIMHFVFDKPVDDPDQMPVTRDLSSTKRRMLINYFNNVMQQSGKTLDRQKLFGQRCPIRSLAGNREDAPVTDLALSKLGKR